MLLAHLACAFLPQLPAAPSPAAPPEYTGAPHGAVRVTYEGTWSLEAHLAKPHDVRTYATRLTVLDGGPQRARLDWSAWDAAHPERIEVETTLVDGARVFHRAEAGQSFRTVSGKPAGLLRARLEAAAPWRTLARIGTAPERLASAKPETCVWSESAADGGFARTFAWDAATKRVTSIERAFAHPRLGDTRDDVRYAGWSEASGVTIPAAFRMREFEGSDALKASPTVFDVHFVSLDPVADAAAELAVPADALPPEAPPAAAEPAPITVTELEPGVLAFASRELDAQTFVVEFADHVVAIGAPLSSALGERIVDAIGARFPAKPIRHLLVGHYHPHYTGGLRAFLAAGASVVATEGIAKLAQEIAARPFTLAPDRWAGASRAPVIETFRGEREFGDATRKLTAIDIGARSQHTDEYTVFWLPATRTLLQDDIGWGATSERELRFGPRSRGLYDAIVERKLDVTTLWQGWPVASPRPKITFAELEAGVRARR